MGYFYVICLYNNSTSKMSKLKLFFIWCHCFFFLAIYILFVFSCDQFEFLLHMCWIKMDYCFSLLHYHHLFLIFIFCSLLLWYGGPNAKASWGEKKDYHFSGIGYTSHGWDNAANKKHHHRGRISSACPLRRCSLFS